MVVEIRNAKNMKLIDTKIVKSRRKYVKLCNKLTKLVEKHNDNYENKDFLIRVRQYSYLVRSGSYGYVIGIKNF